MCLTASFLATSCFKFELFQNACMLYMHAVFAVFMLCVVKILLKREVGGHALNSHGITSLIMGNHGKIMELCF